jgi:hypothetical protein
MSMGSVFNLTAIIQGEAVFGKDHRATPIIGNLRIAQQGMTIFGCTHLAEDYSTLVIVVKSILVKLDFFWRHTALNDGGVVIFQGPKK